MTTYSSSANDDQLIKDKDMPVSNNTSNTMHTGVNKSPRIVTWQQIDRESILWHFDHKSKSLITKPTSTLKLLDVHFNNYVYLQQTKSTVCTAALNTKDLLLFVISKHGILEHEEKQSGVNGHNFIIAIQLHQNVI